MDPQNTGAMSYSSNGSLDHIYFFMDNQPTSTTDDAQRNSSTSTATSNQCGSPRSETASLGSNDTEATNISSSSSSGSSSGSSGLNPNANAFTPTSTAQVPPKPKQTQFYEIRKTDDKGYGIFATTFIPIGKRILCDAPLLRIPENQVHLAWGTYCRLSNTQKAAFDNLHFFKAEDLDLEMISRLCLNDPGDSSLDEAGTEKLVADQIRVMGTFGANNFATGQGLSVFETAARINHSCVPNVHHSFNPTLQKQTVHAVRDIQAGEELTTTYLGGPGSYYIRRQRVEMLRHSYGFTCTCPACSDTTGHSDGRRELLGGLAWGLQQYLEGSDKGKPYVPATPASALHQAESMIHLLIEEGLFSMELIKAYRMASMQALGMHNFEKAMEYAYNEAEVERNCLGKELDDLRKTGMASACWIDQVREVAATYGVSVGRPTKNKKKGGKQAPTAEEVQKKKASEKTREKKAKQKARKVAKKQEEHAKMEAERAKKEYEASWPGLKA